MGQGSLALVDYRRAVAEHYQAVRQGASPPVERWHRWRSQRDQLFRHHSQSPLTQEDRRRFSGLDYFPYDPAYRFKLKLEPTPSGPGLAVQLETDGHLSLQRLGQVRFEIGAAPALLNVYWLEGYGGGVFLPFRDSSNGQTTYGGGRYLLDSIKGADLGGNADQLIIDFNFAYNPSCAYQPRWHCPLAPTENWLGVAIEAGEKKFHGAGMGQPDPSAIVREI